jgi:hypothetical protein
MARAPTTNDTFNAVSEPRRRQILLNAEGGVTRLVVLHRAMRSILPEHRDELPKGWEHWLERIRELAERKNRKETQR